MSDFYHTIAKYYDQIFKITPNEINFITQSTNKKRLLDIACGTGTLAIELAKKGFDITAIDLNDEMLNIAKTKANLNFIQANMLELEKLPHPFDLAYCIGNSIAHLNDLHDIHTFLQQVYNTLTSNGTIILQWIYFENFLSKDTDFLGALPTIQTDKIRFERQYFQANNKIRFHTKLHIDDKCIENDELLFPLTLENCTNTLTKIGFKNIELFADFNQTPFDPQNALRVILRAQKI